MTKFKARIHKSSVDSRIILANDYDIRIGHFQQIGNKKLVLQTIKNIKTLHKDLCGIKLNFQLLLPLGKQEIRTINETAHEYGLQTIADIKLNDIVNTNLATVSTLGDFGFDAVIVNPIMGPSNLKKIITSAHRCNMGVITLCHMSAPEAKMSYEMNVKLSNSSKTVSLHQLFLKWAISSKADGIIVGATFPKIIKECKKTAGKKLDIYSPGIGTQGGKVKETISNGSDFLIVGRTILGSKDPIGTAKKIQLSLSRLM